MKYVVLVGDGMGDLPLAELDGRTPLEAAATPAMDDIARLGELYTVKTIPDGMEAGSDVANLSLLGYRPQEFYSGRAPLEAAAMGVTLGPEEVAFRCNLVTLAENNDGRLTMEDYSAGHIPSDEAAELITALRAGLGDNGVRFFAGVSYRHLLVMPCAQEAPATVPPHDHTGKDVSAYYRRYLASPALARLMDGARRILAGHPVNQRRLQRGQRPANAIWLWGEGRTPAMPAFQDLHGISGALVSAVDLLKGIAVCAGLEVLEVPGATGYLDTDCEGKVAAALAALDRHDFVFVHVEAPDEAGHHGRIDEKLAAIEMFDGRIVAPIVEALRRRKDPFRVLLAMDHYTPVSLLTHDRRPVPVALFDSRRPAAGGAEAYHERAAAASGRYLDDGEALYRCFLARRSAEP